ncbi:MAG: hypothetical protein LBQ60_15060 [Bacteroidales bacterium]|jgi:polygalacturonase|nr:hypothetical protein [Bacteroidales bacterium]
MKKFFPFILITFLFLSFGIHPCKALDIPGVKGDGTHDDTQGIQALLDSKASTVYLPQPAKCYLISKVLKIHSGQTLVVDRNAVIRLADHAGAQMLTNSDHKGGNERITVIGGIWDGNNLKQTMLYHVDRKNKDLPYDPDRYAGVLMQFDNVKQLHISDVTLKDPCGYGFWAGNLYQFTIENVTFDYNLKKGNMDGVHITGNSHHGRIVNVKGATNDDLVALNADDYPMFELSRGPITDIQVDGIWAENAHRAVRMLSCGSPVKRIKISNIYGTYQNEAVILSNHNVHPNCTSEFEDISINGIFCTNVSERVKAPHIKVFSPATVTNLSISDYHRTESASATDNILIEKGATVECLSVINASLFNRTNGHITFLNNQGMIKTLNLTNIFLQGKEPEQVGLIKNGGTIRQLNKVNSTE